jgi:DNA-binding MarR family transcriptional regulator/N-acetylglutamate synthase-like GNAT family acetyltransferase
MSKETPPDTTSRLGELALASRLRRLADALSEEAAALYDDLGTDFQPRWFPFFQTLAHTSPLPITALARALGLTHPGTRQIAEQMIQAGVVRELSKGRDRRQRLLALTPKGRRLQKTLTPVWEEIRMAAREFLEEAGIDLLGALAQLESLQRERSIMDRARDRLGMPARNRLEIVPYRPAFRKHFQTFHRSQRATRAADGLLESVLLKDPNQTILRQGGSILFAVQDGVVAGTCALRRHRGGEVELCLLAVAAELDGRKIEEALLETAISQSRLAGREELYFCPGRGQEAARRLSRRFGFHGAPPPSFLHPELRRSRVALKRDLTFDPKKA